MCNLHNQISIDNIKVNIHLNSSSIKIHSQLPKQTTHVIKYVDNYVTYLDILHTLLSSDHIVLHAVLSMQSQPPVSL